MTCFFPQFSISVRCQKEKNLKTLLELLKTCMTFIFLFFFFFFFFSLLNASNNNSTGSNYWNKSINKKKLELLLCWDCTKIVGINWNFNLSHELSYTLTQRILKRRPIPKSDSRPKCIRHEWNTWGAQSPPLCFNWWQ